MVNYCIGEPRLEKEDIEDVLEDIMDQEFNTLCEDDSVKGIFILRIFRLINTFCRNSTFTCGFPKIVT